VLTPDSITPIWLPCNHTQMQQQGGAAAAPAAAPAAAEKEAEDEGPKFEAFKGKGHSLRG